MPYLTDQDRKMLDKGMTAVNPGDLNYIITKACLAYLKAPHYKGGRYDYRRINEVMGALECAKQEFYRRIAVPYEDKKIKENGDVY